MLRFVGMLFEVGPKAFQRTVRHYAEIYLVFKFPL